MEEQRFLARRHRRRTDISHLLSITPPAPAEPERDALLEENREIVDAVWETALGLGRVPHPEELAADIREALEERIGSIRRAMQLSQRVHNPAALAEARTARVEDLTVVFALNLFNRRQPYQELPVELQRDVKAFFGSYRQVSDAGRDLLFSLGKPATILDACRQAKAKGLGHLFDDHSLQLHVSLIDQLPASLRAYVGCAEKMFGDIGEANTDLVKIHIQSGKLTLLRYDAFNEQPLPKLRERIKIKMREQAIDFFSYSDERPPQYLTMKSRYMAPSQAHYAEQRRFDEALATLSLFDLEGLGPDGTELKSALASAGYSVCGFALERTSPPYGAGSP
jgi:DNA phosphorothioation-associated putative methyltransferase